MALNELPPPSERAKLCSTDSRLRPDIRLMEEGLIDRASEAKTRLEEKQREARKARKSRKEKEAQARYFYHFLEIHVYFQVPSFILYAISIRRWFAMGIHPFTKQEDWLYRGGFWDSAGNQPSVNIF